MSPSRLTSQRVAQITKLILKPTVILRLIKLLTAIMGMKFVNKRIEIFKRLIR
jgi:hypothetical protein